MSATVQDNADRAAADAIAAGELRVEFQANPIQHSFITSRARADLFASRKGEGKSAGLCWAMLFHAKENPGARHLMIRDTWENLRDTTLQEFFEWFPAGQYGTWKADSRTWTWTIGEMAGSTIMFRGADDKSDANKIASMPLGGFFCDEPAPAADSGGIDQLVFTTGKSQLRQKNIKWYACKAAINNTDESHWVYSMFVDPGTEGFKVWQTREPENLKHLPKTYYEEIRQLYRHRPDLIRRLVTGGWGFQQLGKPMTPQFDERLHLAVGLTPYRDHPLHLLWDFGHNPTCSITQVTALGFWNFLETHVADESGVQQFIEGTLSPRIAQRFKGFQLHHIGDHAGTMREQSNILNSAVLVVRSMLGGTWTSGPNDVAARVEPLCAVLGRTIHGLGVVQIDRVWAKPTWYALRGGWHRTDHRDGTFGKDAVKNVHSHPGDAAGYGAAVLFPLVRRVASDRPHRAPRTPSYFGRGSRAQQPPVERKPT